MSEQHPGKKALAAALSDEMNGKGIEVIASYVSDLVARLVKAEAERDEAWRRANIAESKVRGWEKYVVVRDLPMRAVPNTGWGPGQDEKIAIPQVTPEKLTDIIDRAEAARNEALEEAAKICIAYDPEQNRHSNHAVSLNTASNLLDAIRALKSKS